MRTYDRRGVLAAGAALAAGALATRLDHAGAAPPVRPPLGGTLRYYSWFDYVSPETAAAYERATGVRVQWAYFASNEALRARLRSGARYDLANPTGYMVAQLAEDGLLRRIDWQRLPRARKHLDRRFLFLPHDPRNLWSVPKDWGTTGFVYRTDLVRERPSTWRQFFALVRKYPRRLTLLDGAAEVIGSVAVMLGYSFNTEREAELAHVRETLLALRPFVHSVDSRGYVEAIVRGGAFGGMAWNGDGAYVVARSPRNAADYVVPRDGGELWVDAHVIPRRAANPAAAHAWIDFVYTPRIAALETLYTTFGSPLRRSSLRPVLASSVLRNPDIFPSETTLRRLESSDLSPRGIRRREAIWAEFRRA